MNSRPRKQLTGLLLTLAFVLVPLTALCVGDAAARAASPEPSPTPALAVNGRIAFTTTPDFPAGKFDRDINVVNADGTGGAPLIDTFSHQEDPAWSADGKYIAYTSAQNGYYEIYRADADGSNQTRLSDGVDVGAVDDSPAWSPDGQKIVFVRNRQLWTVGRDGGTAVKLSTGSDEDEQPAWSPDGSKIVFVRNYSSATAQVWVMDADGTNQRNLSNDEWSFNRTPAWSPDGSRIAFHRFNHIWVMDADGSNQTQVTFPVGTAGGGYDKPSWSPDGTQIAVNGQFYEPEIFVMNADGSNITKIANGSNPSWQSLPALALTTVHWPDPVVPGAELTYTLTATNNHTLMATGATLTDTLDAGTTFVSATASKGSCVTPPAGETGSLTCSLGDLVKGEQATVTLVVRVTAADGATLHNAATAAADYAGYGRQTQSAETSTQVVSPSADVSVATWINEGLYTPAGGQVVYGVGVFNSGPAPAEGVTLTGHLPAGVTIDSINNDGGSCAAAPGGLNFTCTFPPLGLYENQTIFVTATSNASGAPYTPLTATFSVAGDTPDNAPDNNNAVADFYIAAPPLPAPTPGASNDGLLAYPKQLLSSGQGDIFRQRADGAGIVNLTDDDPAWEGFFAWSPDGSRLAFLRYDFGNQTTSLGTVAADGSGRTLLTSVPGEYIDSCSWSPDGTRLAFSARPFDTQAVNDVFVINADGTGRSNLTNGDGFNIYPSWSPDGTRVGYARWVYGAEGLASSDVRVVGADGSGLVQIPQAAGEFDSFPRWSPDGSRLAFTRALPDGSTGLYTALSDGTDLRPLTNDAAINDTFLRWSPDGSKLSYSYRREDGTSTLEVVRADGTGRTTIYEAPADGTSYDTGSDKWSPDGARLVFDACGPECFTSSVYVVGADGAGRIELGSGAEQNFNPDWSPDGRRVAFQTSRNGVSRINIINADGTGRVELPGEEGYHGAPIWQPRKAGDTPAGANVLVVENGVAVNFSNVTTAGVTTVTPIDPNSLQGIPGEYVINAGTLAFEIQTTATYAGPITIGFQVPGVNDPITFDALRVLHGEPAPNFVDRTVLAPDSPAPDFATRTVYARVTSLSPFVVAQLKATYGVRTLYDETKTHKSGSTVPVKLQLTNAAGANVSSSSLVVKAVGTTRISTNAAGTLEDAGNSNPDYDFRYDAGLSGYVYNLKTKGYAPGTYVLTFRVAGDPTAHTVQFRVAK
jgi:uncharacterized repeat protein (TIGR01451 family)